MAASLIIIVVLVAIVFLSRSAAARRKRMVNDLGAQVARSIQASAGGGADLGQNIAQAVQRALEAQDLPTGDISVRTSVAVATDRPAASDPIAGIDRANLGVGEVMSISSLTGSRVAAVDLDAIGAPKRRVTVELSADAQLTRGDRIYVRLDPKGSAVAALVPDLAPPTTANRLDPLVLQPMLLAHGEQGKGIVRSAESLPLPTAGSGAGASSWRLELGVSPRSGFPYRAEIVTTVSTPEKAARICHAGAEVPVRYDPSDPKTVIIDGAALGFAPPPQAATAVDAAGLGAMSTIERIKAVREQTGLGQAQAKAVVDAMDGAGLSATDRMTAMLSGRN